MDIGDIRAALENVRTRGDLEAVFAVAAELAGGAAPAWAVAQSVWRTEDEENEPELLPVAEWAARLGPQPNGHVEKLIPPNSVFLLAGKPKSGKTFMALEIAEAVALGDRVLGLGTRRGPVCYFSMEDSPWQFKERCAQRGTLDRAPELYIYKGRRDVSTPEGVVWLEQKIADVAPSLVVLDTARQAFGMANWNDAAEVTTRLRPLMDLAGRLPNGGSILLVAHSNKNPLAEGGDRISGSNALQSAVDCYMILDKVRRNQDEDLEGEAECQGRIDMPPKFGWTMNRYSLRFRRMDDNEKEQKQRSQIAAESTQRVTEALRWLGTPSTTVEICNAMQVTTKYGAQMIRAAVKRGAIVEAGKQTLEDGRMVPVWAPAVNIEPVEVEV